MGDSEEEPTKDLTLVYGEQVLTEYNQFVKECMEKDPPQSFEEATDLLVECATRWRKKKDDSETPAEPPPS